MQAMDSTASNQLDIFEIYDRYCGITSESRASVECGYRTDDESKKAKFSRDALFQLLRLVESREYKRISIFEEVYKLMSSLGPVVDSNEFSRFYNFVFFICRENGQRSITVGRAIMAWRLVLSGRFRLLNQWCIFVEKNQRHNISEDTWRQVLAFSRCVHENLEGYDPTGAWPILIDDFVEHMYRMMGSHDKPNLFCNCDDSETQQIDDSLPGLKTFPGAKRKVGEDLQEQVCEVSNAFPGPITVMSSNKRRHTEFPGKFMNSSGNASYDHMEIVKHNSSLSCSKSPCAVEGCLSKGFAGLFSSRSCLQFDGERRVSYT